MNEPYYLAYEHRYRKVYAAGIERWGHRPDETVLLQTLTKWVDGHRLRGKKVIEFACGEILSRLGCVYHGVDIAPSAVEKARRALKPYPNAAVSLLDMVNDPAPGSYDAALDCMGFHMLVLDADRRKYLRNAVNCLRSGAPMLFFRESYRRNAPAGPIETIAQWQSITGEDYKTPEKRSAAHNGIDMEVFIPLVPGRARTKDDYIEEMTDAGFAVDSFMEMELNDMCPFSATMYVHKPRGQSG